MPPLRASKPWSVYPSRSNLCSPSETPVIVYASLNASFLTWLKIYECLFGRRN